MAQKLIIILSGHETHSLLKALKKLREKHRLATDTIELLDTIEKILFGSGPL